METGPIGDPSVMNTPEGASWRPRINDSCSGKFVPFVDEVFSSCLPQVPVGHLGLFKLNPYGVFCLPGVFIFRGLWFSGQRVVPGLLVLRTTHRPGFIVFRGFRFFRATHRP
jgi:hypothetical protein